MSDTFICEKTGLEFKRIPAPRGNRHRLIEGNEVGSVYPFWISTTPICGKHVQGIEFAPDNQYKQGPVQITGPEYPVVNISYNDCTEATLTYGKRTYIGLLHYPRFKPYRLPTQFEWEWAALGGENFEYAGSANHLKVAWTHQDYRGNCNALQPAKLKSPNGYGLYDMSGNIFEWTSTGEDSYRVIRGGSWFHAPANARVAYRLRFAPDFRSVILGVRLCFYGDSK